MAVRGWGGTLATALGIAAGAGAAQLGFGYGLGIIDWAPPGAGTDEAFWVASLAWATWIAATSTIAGAVGAQRLSRRPAAEWTVGRVLPTALAAALGALVTVFLVAVPARAATPVETGSPPTVAAGYAAIGVLVGLVVAGWALLSPPAAGNVVATVGWIWLLAVVAVVDGVLSGRGLGSAQLGIWQITDADSGRFWIRDHFYWPGALLSLGSALLIGAFAARRAARQTYRRVGAAASGGAGPLLVALAYFLAVPRVAAIRPEQVSAHLIAPYAVVAGIAGSVLVAALAQRRDAATATPATPATAATPPAEATTAGEATVASGATPTSEAAPPGGQPPAVEAAAGDTPPLVDDPATAAARPPVVGTTPPEADPPATTGASGPVGAETGAATDPVPTDPASGDREGDLPPAEPPPTPRRSRAPRRPRA